MNKSVILCSTSVATPNYTGLDSSHVFEAMSCEPTPLKSLAIKIYLIILLDS